MSDTEVKRFASRHFAQKKKKEYISFESVEALCSDANQMGKCSRQVPSQRAALPAGKGAQWSHLEITKFSLYSNSGRKGEARLFLAAWLSRRAWECLCSELYSQGQDAGAAKVWGSPPTDSRPGAGAPFQACCESVPAVFLGCCHCRGRFPRSRWLKLSKCHTTAVPPVTPPFQGMAAHTTGQPSSGKKEVTELKMVLLFQKSFVWNSTDLNSLKNRSLLHPHKHHFFVLFLSRPVTPRGPWNFPSGRHTGRHKAMKKISPALPRVSLPSLLLSSFHLIYFNHYHHTVAQTLVLWPTSSCEMCALLLHDSLCRCQESCSLCFWVKKCNCLSVKAWQRRCLYGQSMLGSFPKRNRKGIVTGERGHLWRLFSSVLFLYSE